ncbi:winged helix-turn-helix transcriptional regulator [Sphingoaurantiacus capsulatus]|uniref:Winged helix-turn-helix transcriptional regulator n=1 Tax=Sphingoaurantiacus capsulatus TaxID=1771310 RepID=A0ABV7X905_9SPHN
MPKRVSAPDYCLIARSMDVLGEQWTMLIVRDAFFGIRNFDDFQKSLGIARNVLATRLAKLVEEGILSRRVSEADRRKVEYKLTQKGRDLFPMIIGLSQWGAKHLRRPDELSPFAIVDRANGHGLAPVEVRAADGRTLTPFDTVIVSAEGTTDTIRANVPPLRNAG